MAKLAGLGDGDRDGPVLERVSRINRIVLDVEIFEPYGRAQSRCVLQGCESYADVGVPPGIHRQQIHVPPQADRSAFNFFAADDRLDVVVVEGDLQRSEAEFADVYRLRGILSATFPAAQTLEVRHRVSPPGCTAGHE